MPVTGSAEMSSAMRGLVRLVGGTEPAGALYAEIDEPVLKVSPVSVATGIPLFSGKDDSSPRRFTLSEQVTLESGVTFLTYGATGIQL
jgi:dihydrofolate reductase